MDFNLVVLFLTKENKAQIFLFKLAAEFMWILWILQKPNINT